MDGLICVDIGTTSLRALLFDARGVAHHVAARACAPDYFEGGRVEQDAERWRTALIATLRECAQAAASTALTPAGIVLTSQRSSVLPVDAAGRPLHPALMWQDTRSGELAAALAATHDGAVYRRTGLRISPVFSAVKMAWLRRERPAVWAATHKLLGVQDWAVWLLSGRFATDHTFGSRTNLMNLAGRCWDDELLSLFGVPRDLLCELIAPGAEAGRLHDAAAAATGLRAGLPVISAGGDQQCAALGLGLLGADRAVTNVGTGCYLIGHARSPVFDEHMRVACNVSALPGAWIVEASILTAGAVHRWFARLLDERSDDNALFARLDAEAAASPPGARGVRLLPHFRGAGTPHWDPAARGALLNLSLDHTRGDIARALLEGIAAELRGGLDAVQALTAPVHSVCAAGGMTRSPLFDQILADMMERPTLAFGDGEATAQGAWVAGAVATGLAASHGEAVRRLEQRRPPRIFTPDPGRAADCRRLRDEALNIYRALALLRGGTGH
ncbi:MAG: hypothetical protein AMXMBFR66_18970 [Pseudomonadota bacterium]|nr:hypothetical protein [Rubrivivax sp.]NLZ42378.1 carbohydrate kinase [Comamonadaceae bacterium]